MTLATITSTILDETSPPERLHRALDDFSRLCSEITGVQPDPGFDAWAEDSFLDSGVAINPRAAAHCVGDYQRSVVFIRGVYAAIKAAQALFPGTPIQILYAGCGPYATLLLPLLGKFEAAEFDVYLLDIHQQSLDSVRQLLSFFGLNNHRINTVQADASSYQHPGTLHLVIAETMQKSLEQEPQFAVTANLAPQLCPRGIFIPEKIELELCLADQGTTGKHYPLATLFTLVPERAAAQLSEAVLNEGTGKLELESGEFKIPAMENLERLDPLIFTRIQVFDHYRLQDYEAEITLPLRCHELLPLKAGASYQVSYQLGNYPRFELARR